LWLLVVVVEAQSLLLDVVVVLVVLEQALLYLLLLELRTQLLLALVELAVQQGHQTPELMVEVPRLAL
jgi:hypothetical protein